jgi:hypothetical protein
MEEKCALFAIITPRDYGIKFGSERINMVKMDPKGV